MNHKFKKIETRDHLGMVWIDEVCLYCAQSLYNVPDSDCCLVELKPNSYTENRFLDFLENL